MNSIAITITVALVMPNAVPLFDLGACFPMFKFPEMAMPLDYLQ